MSLTSGSKLGVYEIIAAIGAGGMGEVYRARDTKLGREVAIKVLPEEVAADRERLRRFEQEARAASALNHPNIITIHDIAEDESTRYIVMEYVKGKTLREVLGTRALPLKKLLQIAPQIADGLAKAHSAGIVHRDLKPDNLMVTEDGFVKILDFGLAKLVPQLTDSEAATMTQEGTTPGVVMGTVGYMSPEQAKGITADFRADQFSLGAILYEMATGKRAFQRDTAVQTLSAIIESEPRSLAELNPSLPAHLRAIVRRCLSKDPGERYDSTRDLARDLKSVQEVSSEAPTEDRVSVTRDGGRVKIQVEEPGGEKIHIDVPERTALVPLVALIVVVTLALVVGLNVGGIRDRLFGEPAPVRIESVAVLPLENLSGDPEEEYFADGMTEALIADLAKIGSLKVISRTSVMLYKGSDKPLPEIARELGVDAIVEGSALRVGDRVRITAQLIEAATDQHLWAESYERDLRDVLALQSEVARTIAKEIQITLTPQEEARLASARPVDPEAHEAYLKGRANAAKLTREGYEASINLYQQALEEDPSYAVAYAGIARSFYRLTVRGTLPPKEGMPKAREAATKALAIDSSLADAHATLASIKYGYDWDWLDAERRFKRAIELNPSSSSARLDYAFYLVYMGRDDEGIAESRRARELDPLSRPLIVSTAVLLYMARQYDRSVAELKRILEIEPDLFFAHVVLSWNYALMGMWEEKIAADQKALMLAGASPEEVAELGQAYATSGVRGLWEWRLRREKERATHEYVPDFQFAGIHASLGNIDQACLSLERAYEKRAFELVGLKSNPWLDPLRSDPRYHELIRRMNFPE